MFTMEVQILSQDNPQSILNLYPKQDVKCVVFVYFDDRISKITAEKLAKSHMQMLTNVEWERGKDSYAYICYSLCTNSKLVLRVL